MLNSFLKNRSSVRSAFTLVELLVVITIIAILTGLLLAGAQSAILAGKRASIKATMNNMDAALEDYKNTLGSYPPATQTDGGDDTNDVNDATVLSAFKRHLKKAYPQHREPDGLIRGLVGMGTGAGLDNPNLPGGMTAAEALVFFLTKMSDDPRYPISGAGGPSYIPTSANENEDDPIDSRSWWMELKTEQLGPRTDNGYFDGTDSRFITYNDPQGGGTRRINFWYFKDRNNVSPYLYFDASRGSGVAPTNDAPASIGAGYAGPDSEILNELANVFAIKTESSNANAINPFVFANKGKFQILHCGIDDIWGSFPRADLSGGEIVLEDQDGNVDEITYPTGPWTGDIRDTLTNFTDGTLEDAQP